MTGCLSVEADYGINDNRSQDLHCSLFNVQC
jgi:hypothetical protein